MLDLGPYTATHFETRVPEVLESAIKACVFENMISNIYTVTRILSHLHNIHIDTVLKRHSEKNITSFKVFVAAEL